MLLILQVSSYFQKTYKPSEYVVLSIGPSTTVVCYTSCVFPLLLSGQVKYICFQFYDSTQGNFVYLTLRL